MSRASIRYVIMVATAGLGCLLALPAFAGADATIEGPPLYSSASGLPDGRVYEQVSPADKHGNEAGAGTSEQGEGVTAHNHYAVAAADGNSVLFEGTGPMGETAAGTSIYFVAQHSAAGWTTRAVMPRTKEPALELEGTLEIKPTYLDPSSDLSHAMFESSHGTFATLPDSPCLNEGATGQYQLYLSGPDPFAPATWLERPAIANPIEACASSGEAGAPVGGTPNFSTVYFTYPGTLLGEDASRSPNADPKEADGFGVEAWGFYEDSEGVLHNAGMLPDDKLSPFGAVPAASGHGRALAGNQIADEGRRAFFVSPDPMSCEQNGGHNNCAIDPPELYLRESGEKTLLISENAVPGEVGQPASDGVSPMANSTLQLQDYQPGSSYIFASPDGSQAFFQSEDRLTSDAPEGPPGNTSPKTYDFDVDTGVLTYLPNVAGQIVATDADGSSLAFVRPEAGASPAELDLWSAAPGGGTVTAITQLPDVSIPEAISEARMSSDGSVLVFLTGSPLSAGAFNNSGGFEQVYRYDATTNKLGCVSCAPRGVTPTGSAVMSQTRARELANIGIGYATGIVDSRGLSSNGSRIFFDTPDPLVPQATNSESENRRDVYEWENGVVYLISSGKSTRDSYFLDNSENGDDVFFATAEGLVPGDADGAYDVYDARIPHPGDNPPATATPCEGSVCQGPPSVPAFLGAPAGATFSGLGNPAPEPPPALSGTITKKCKKGYAKTKKDKCVKQKPKKKARLHVRGTRKKAKSRKGGK